MLENLPLSAYAICYGPLVLVILGFIGFAALTDANARRTYLRRVDLRPESERPMDEPFAIEKPVRAETPAGGRVTILPQPRAETIVPVQPLDGGSSPSNPDASTHDAPSGNLF